MEDWLVAVYVAAATLGYHRWRAAGVVGACAVFVAVELAWGTIEWRLPHTEFEPRWSDWGCHAVGALPVFLLLGAGIYAAQRLTRTQVTSFGARLAISVLALAVLSFPLIGIMIYWNIMFLGCDTL
jgi:hypothetical protein